MNSWYFIRLLCMNSWYFFLYIMHEQLVFYLIGTSPFFNIFIFSIFNNKNLFSIRGVGGTQKFGLNHVNLDFDFRMFQKIGVKN